MIGTSEAFWLGTISRDDVIILYLLIAAVTMAVILLRPRDRRYA